MAADVSVDTELELSDTVRRYIDLPKYLDLIRSKDLYLRRADSFSDRFEGALPPLFRRTINEAHAKGQSDYDADYFYRRSRVGNYVCCWNLDECDNMALWQLYGGVSNSVAIISTLEDIIKMGLLWETKVLLHKVKYIDHAKNPDMIIGRYTELLRFKHEAYAYEGELRIIVPEQGDGWENNPIDLRLPISDINTLIRGVVVAPEAGTWFYELVKDVSEKYGISAPVLRSALTYLPE